MHSSLSRKAMPLTGIVEAHLPLCWVIALCSLFTAHLTWSAAPKIITTGSIGRIWPPIIVQAPRAIGAAGTQRAHRSKQAPDAGWCWAAHYALLRAGAENGSWEGHDHRWWVDHSSRVTTGCYAGLVPGICNWLRAGHFAGRKATGANHLPVGRHLLGMEINLKHTTPRQHKAESSDTKVMEIMLRRERIRNNRKTRRRVKISVLSQQPCPFSHLLMPSSSPSEQSPFLLALNCGADLIHKNIINNQRNCVFELELSVYPFPFLLSTIPFWILLWHLIISFINNCRKEQKHWLARM